MDVDETYQDGLATLLRQLGTDHPRYSEALVYEQRLRENLARVRRYGETEAQRADRAEIIDHLNALALTTVGQSFNALCETPPAPPAPATATPDLTEDPTTPATPSPTSSVLPLSSNPFTPGQTVSPAHFIGRQRELSRMLDSLESMLSVSLVGPPRIGKSSMLRYLEARLPELLGNAACVPIYLSMDSQRDQAAFCKAVLAPLLPRIPAGMTSERELRSLEQRVAHGPAITLEETARLLEQTSPQPLRVVLLLDEFKDLLERSAEFDEVFRGVLRSLYTHGHVAMVMVTRQPLTAIAGLDAYFVNGVEEQTLGKMPTAEGEELLRQPHDRPFSDEEVRIGLEVGDGHPLRLQWAGFRLYQWKGQPSNPLYDETGALRGQARRILGKAVQQQHKAAIARSRGAPRRRNPLAWIAALGRTALGIGAAADTAKVQVMGAFIVIVVLTIFGLLLACAAGWITPAELGEILRTLTGGP